MTACHNNDKKAHYYFYCKNICPPLTFHNAPIPVTTEVKLSWPSPGSTTHLEYTHSSETQTIGYQVQATALASRSQLQVISEQQATLVQSGLETHLVVWSPIMGMRQTN